MKKKIIKTFYIFFFFIIVPFTVQMILKPLYALSLPQNPQQRKDVLTARAVIRGIKAAIENSDKEIQSREARSAEIKDLFVRISATQKEIQSIKDSTRISPLEAQIDAIKANIDIIATQIYAASVVQGQSLYLPISRYIKSLTENSIIKKDLLEIFDRLQDIRRQMGNAKSAIREIGKQISIAARPQKLLIKQEKSKILPIQMEIDKILLREDINNRLETLNQAIIEYQNQIEQAIPGLTEEDKNQIERYKNVKARYQLILEFLRDPDKIQTITDEQLIGLEPLAACE